MADFNVTENTIIERRIEPFWAVIILNAGEKLSDKTVIQQIGSKTVPPGYRVKVYVDIKAEVEKL